MAGTLGLLLCGRCGTRVWVPLQNFPLVCHCGNVVERPFGEKNRQANYAKPLPYGPGHELTTLIADLKLSSFGGCGCQAMADNMDRWGVAGCREPGNHALILQQLRKSAESVGWLAKSKAALNSLPAGLVGKINPFDPIPGLIRVALERSEAKDAWQPVRHCLYHVAPLLSNDLWKTNVRQLIRRAAIFTGRRIAAIATGPECHNPAIVREAFTGSGFEFLEVPNDKQLREVASFCPLLRQVEHQPGVTFYAHTKGNSTALNVTGATRWRNAMYHYLLDDFEPVRRALTAHAFCGTHKMYWHGPPPYPTGLQAGNWMLAGTFYWFRHDRTFSVPNWWDLPADRYAAEAWPSMVSTEADAWSLYQPWPKNAKHPNPYDPKLYPAEFDDE